MSFQFSAYLGVASLADVGYRFYDVTETATAARQTSGVVDAGEGWYSVQATPPVGSVEIRWNSAGTAAAKAREYFLPGPLIAAVSVFTGSGAYAVTITVTDGSSTLENARVRFSSGVTSFVGYTNASGVVAFSLDAATYVLSITKGGYSFTPINQVVSGVTTLTKAMSATVTPSPTSPELCVLYGFLVEPDGTALASTEVTIQLVASRNATTTGQVAMTTPFTVSTDVDGYLEVELLRTDEFKRPNVFYALTCAAVGWQKKQIVLASEGVDVSTL